MKKLIVFAIFIFLISGINCQIVSPVGNWILIKHSVFDSAASNYLNIFNGQTYRGILFNSDGTLKIFYGSEKFYGSWSLKGKRQKFSMNYFNADTSSYHGWSTDLMDFSSGEFEINERLPILYGEAEDDSKYANYSNIDSLMDDFMNEIIRDGNSTYIRDIDSFGGYIDFEEASKYYALGIQKISNNPFDTTASDFFRLANSLRPGYYVMGYYWRARLKPDLDKEALELLEFAIKLDPGNSDLYIERARRLQLSGNSLDCLYDLNWALMIKGDDDSLITVRNNIFEEVTSVVKDYGISYKKPEDTIKANLFYQKAIELLTENPGEGFPKIGYNYFRKASQLWPYHYWEAYYLSDWYEMEYNSNRLKNLNIAISLNPKESRLYLAKYYSRDDKNGINYLNIAMLLDSSKSDYHTNRGLFLEDNFQLTELAIQEMTRAIELNGSDSYAYYQRGLLYLRIKDMDRACSDLKKAKELGHYDYYYMKKCGIESD